IADVETGCGTVEADIAGDRSSVGCGIEPLRVGALMDVAAVLHHPEEGGWVAGHADRAGTFGWLGQSGLLQQHRPSNARERHEISDYPAIGLTRGTSTDEGDAALSESD